MSSMNFSLDYGDLVRGIEGIVKVPYYYVLGSVKDSVIVLVVTEGERALMTLKDDRQETLTKDLIHAVVRRQNQEMISVASLSYTE